MNKISCDVCMDLLPLVKDGIASEDSKHAVEAHVTECALCRRLYQMSDTRAGNVEKSWVRLVNRMRFWFILILMFGISFGLGLADGQEMFYNSILMPVIGVAGYFIFSWKAVIIVPLLLLITEVCNWLMAVLRGIEEADLFSSLWWIVICSFFVLLGIVIAGLLHWALSKKEWKIRVLRIAGLVAATVLISGVAVFANALVGNPVSRYLATQTAKQVVKETYAGTDYEIEEIMFSFKDTQYYAHIVSPSSRDTVFSLCIDLRGNLRHDNYEHLVLNGNNTAARLSREYRALVDTVLVSPDFPYASDIGFGDLMFESREWLGESGYPASLVQEELEMDKEYDVSALGKEAGELVLYVQDEVVTVERAAEILLDLRRIFDEKNIGIYSVDFVLEPLKKEVQGDVWVRTGHFLYSDIYEEGMAERVRAAHDAVVKRFAEEDAKRAPEEP